MWFVCETPPDNNKLGGGLFFSDGSSVSMTGYGESWPSITNSSPYAQADFVIIQSFVGLGETIQQLCCSAYLDSNREHLFFMAE